MWCKPYGRTGKQISVVSFGGMRFKNPDDTESGAELVLHAHEKGINYFDTAPGYFGGKSEKIMGAAFRQLPRDSFYCSTKCMSADGPELRESLETSLERMAVDRIDFFHIWCVVRPEQWQERRDGGAIAAALKAKEEGLVSHMAVSVHLNGPDTCQILQEDFLEGVTLPYNALNFPFRSEALECAAARELGVVTMNPLGGGLIAKNPERMEFLKGPRDRSAVEAAIRFNISHPAVTSALVGFSIPQHVDEAVAAVEDFQAHDAEHVENVKRQVRESFDGFCTMCGYCLPCPADVEISRLMEAYDHRILMGSDDHVRGRLKWHWGLAPDAAAACLDCGECEQRCTQHLEIRERLKEIASLAQ